MFLEKADKYQNYDEVSSFHGIWKLKDFHMCLRWKQKKFSCYFWVEKKIPNKGVSHSSRACSGGGGVEGSMSTPNEIGSWILTWTLVLTNIFILNQNWAGGAPSIPQGGITTQNIEEKNVFGHVAYQSKAHEKLLK